MTIGLQPVHRKLKVSVITPDLSGGGVTRAYLLARVLQRLEYEVSVFGFLFGKEIYPVPPRDLRVHALPGCTYPKFMGAAANLVRDIDGDVIYAVKPQPTSFGMALLKKLKSRCPVILDIDDWEMSWFGGDKYRYRPDFKQFARDVIKPDGALRFPNHKLYLRWMEKLVNVADAITVDTRFLQSRFGGTYLPNGKDTDLFDPTVYDPEVCRSRYGLSGYRVLMFPGTARPHKGLEDVLAALEHLNEPDLKLVLVGGRKPDNYDDRLIERWGRWIIRLPTFPSEKMPEVVAAAHVVVVPQRDTPTARAQFPLKMTDGMAMAKPILTTQVGDIPQILGEVGYIVDPESPEQLAETIRWIFAHPEEASQKGIEARKRCVQHYSVEAMAATLSGVIQQSLSK